VRSKKLLSTLVILALLQPSISIAATPKKITTCANKKTGVIRLATKCAKTETKLTWNQSGPVGPKGATIHNGPTLPNTPEDQTPIGDYFLVTSTMTLYGPKTDKGWPEKGFTLQGPAGSGGSGPQGPKGDTGSIGPKGDPGAAGGVGFAPQWGYFWDQSDIQQTSNDTPLPISCSEKSASNVGVTLETNGSTLSKIKVAIAGTYNIQFSSQLHNDFNGAVTISIWLKKNGIDIPWSNTEFEIPKKDATGKRVASWNFFVPMNTTDYVELYWKVEATSYTGGVYIDSTPAGTNVPAIPGTILTVNQVG